VIKLTVVIVEGYYCYQLHTKFLSRLSSYVAEIIGDHQCGFRPNRSTTHQIFSIRQILEKNGSTMRQYISYSLTSRKHIIQLGGKYCTIFHGIWGTGETR
jgi:hypothetical protein